MQGFALGAVLLFWTLYFVAAFHQCAKIREQYDIIAHSRDEVWRSSLRLAGELAADLIEQTSFVRSR